MSNRPQEKSKMRKISFPIRLKIMVTLLLVITAVLSTITFTMANLFHDDKRVYMNDLTSVMAMSTAEECRSILSGYSDRLASYGRIMYDPDLDPEKKQELLESFFEDFEELVGITIHDKGELVSSAFDGAALEAAGLSQDDFRDYRDEHPVPMESLTKTLVYVENTTLSEALPTLTITQLASNRGHTYVLSAVVHLDDLLDLAARSRLFLKYVIDSRNVLLAHPDAARVVAREAAPLPDGIELLRRRGSASVTRMYERDGEALIAGHASAELGDVVVAAEIPRTAIYLASRTLLRSLLGVSFALLVAAAVISALGSRRITRPVERLLAATRAIGRGQFDVQVEVSSADEIGTLAESFNHMAVELHERDAALSAAQKQLIQSEKLAALGELGAAIAHEVKNPLAGILGCAQLSMRKIDDPNTLERNLKLIDKETKRCKTIVENLLKFARPETPEMESLDVNQIVSETKSIVGHQLEMHSVTLNLDLGEDLPAIHGNANQLQQVLMNILMNAQQAMDGSRGAVTVSTARPDEDHVAIRIRDDGPGMPEDIKQKVFDPFFSTKPRGKGTGLGLSVSFGIVRDHKGEISVESEQGKGTEFTILLPTASSRPSSEESGVAA